MYCVCDTVWKSGCKFQNSILLFHCGVPGFRTVAFTC